MPVHSSQTAYWYCCRAAKGLHEHLLFVEPNPGKTDTTFFTDRNKGELWEGYRLGVPESQDRYEITCRALGELHSTLKAALVTPKARMRILRGLSADTERLLDECAMYQPQHDAELATVLSEMRLIKDSVEVKALQSAIMATKRGFEDVIARLKTAKAGP